MCRLELQNSQGPPVGSTITAAQYQHRDSRMQHLQGLQLSLTVPFRGRRSHHAAANPPTLNLTPANPLVSQNALIAHFFEAGGLVVLSLWCPQCRVCLHGFEHGTCKRGPTSWTPCCCSQQSIYSTSVLQLLRRRSILSFPLRQFCAIRLGRQVTMRCCGLLPCRHAWLPCTPQRRHLSRLLLLLEML